MPKRCASGASGSTRSSRQANCPRDSTNVSCGSGAIICNIAKAAFAAAGSTSRRSRLKRRSERKGGGTMRHYLAAATLLCAAMGGIGPAAAQTALTSTQMPTPLPEDLNVLVWSQDQRANADKRLGGNERVGTVTSRRHQT